MSETNLSSALEQSASNPSVFEVIAQENLNELFRPACRHLIEVIKLKFRTDFKGFHL